MFGHLVALRGNYIHEVLMGGEGLQRKRRLRPRTRHRDRPAIGDTSREGRYYNARFKALADELGLCVDRDDVIGWC